VSLLDEKTVVSFLLMTTPLVMGGDLSSESIKPIDRCVECTSSVLQALVTFRDLCPGYRKDEIEICVKNATKFIENEQQPDGSWYLELSFIK